MTSGLFRIGIIEIRPGVLRIRNLIYDRTLTLTPAEEERWRAWLERRLADSDPARYGDTA